MALLSIHQRQIIRNTVLFLVITFTIISCSENSSVPLGNPNTSTESALEGTILGPQGETLDGVLVQLFDNGSVIAQGVTSNLGSFSFGNIEDFNLAMVLVVSSENFEYFSSTLSELAPARQLSSGRYIISLKPVDNCCNQLLINVMSNTTSAFIKGATVTLTEPNTNVVRTALSDENGRANFSGLCNGVYSVSIKKQSFVDANLRDIPLQNCKTEFKEKVLTKIFDSTCCKSSLSFAVLSFAGNNLPETSVTLWNEANQLLDVKVSNENGNVEFTNLCQGVYRINFLQQGYKPQDIVEPVDCNKKLSRTAVLEPLENEEQCCGGSLELVLRDSSNQLLGDARVRLYFEDIEIDERKTNKLGRVIFPNLCEGSYEATISVGGYRRAEIGTDLGCDEKQIVEEKIDTN